MHLFPYPPRPFQAEAVALVAATARAGGHLVLEAPTGTGKTVILLAGTLAAALETGKKVLYVTRTNSQQEQAIRELDRIRTASGRPLRGFALQGRQRLCLKLEDADDPELPESNSEDLSHYCSDAKRLAENEATSPKACKYFANLLPMSDDDLKAATGDAPRTAETFKRIGRERGFCSYEATKRLLPDADVIVAPYVFAFDPGPRQRLFQWWNVLPEDVILVVDEAHNLPGYLRESFSPHLGRDSLRKALGESASLGDPAVVRHVTSKALLEALAEILDQVVLEYAQEEDGFVPPFEVESELLGRFHLTTSGLLQASDALVQLGEIVKDRKRLAGRIPRSALAGVARFLRRWIESDDAGFVKLAVREPRPYLEAFCVDASIPGEALRPFHATVHASGTLAPLAEYRDTLGLGIETRMERFPSPFPPGRLVVTAARGLTTKYKDLKSDPGHVDRLQTAVERFLAQGRVSGAVFFPSHQLLDEFRGLGVLEAHAGQTLVETRGMTQDGVMDLVHAHRDAPGRSLLVGVLGGRLSEGLDFPGAQLESLLVVGAPFPKPTARQRALFHYYETKHGKGWDYAVNAPTVRRLRQALGRLIRGPDDRGFAAILDERAASLLEAAGVPCSLQPYDDVVQAYARWQASDTVK